jgi:DNA-binding IclR family transcriptional regulator
MIKPLRKIRSARRPDEGTPDGSVRAVRRAFAILRAFRLTDRSLALGEIAHRAALDKGTTRRLLMTLMREHLIDQNAETKNYSLSLGVLELGAGLTPCDDLRQRAQPVLAAIAEATGATAFLGVFHDDAALCIGRVDGGQAIQIRSWSIGGRIPLHCGAGPRVLMAHRPESERRRLLARPLETLTPFSPCDPQTLAAILAQIRSRGWELGVNDVVEGLTSLGVPVRDRAGAVIGAVSISGLHAHIVEGNRPRHLAILQRKMQELANAVG